MSVRRRRSGPPRPGDDSTSDAASDGPLFGLLGRFMARLDGERHHEVRAHFARIFTPKRTSAYEDRIRNRARALLDAMEGKGTGTGELVSDFARPLPFGVISDVLGVPLEDQSWLESTMATMSGAFAGQRDPAQVDRGDAAVLDLLGYFDAALTGRTGAPQDDLISTLATDATAGVSRDDLVANCVFFLLAGHATTTTLLAAGADLLSQRPEDLASLSADPTRWEPAVEELLRFISPISTTGVGVPEDVVVGEHRFLAGSNRLLCFAAANRDPEVFADPDRLHIERDPNRHLAFSVGALHCLGAPLARLHGRIGLHGLFQRLPALEVLGEPIWEQPGDGARQTRLAGVMSGGGTAPNVETGHEDTVPPARRRISSGEYDDRSCAIIVLVR